MRSPGCSVALIGSRGIPGRYGGYETLMEELGAPARRPRLPGDRLLPLPLDARGA